MDAQKVIFLLGQKSPYSKFPSFLCLKDSRAKDQHYVKKALPFRTKLKSVDKNVIANPLAPRDKIIFPLPLIKLELMKHFVKALNKESKCFEFLGNTFRDISIEKNGNF